VVAHDLEKGEFVVQVGRVMLVVWGFIAGVHVCIRWRTKHRDEAGTCDAAWLELLSLLST
jgi:hypothetical protein